MASIHTRTIRWTTKDGTKRETKKYQARYVGEDGQERARLFALKKDARAWLDEQTAALVRGTWTDPKSGKETLRAYAARWEKIQVGSEGTARIVDNALRLHILPRLGDMQIGAIRRSDIQAAVKAWEATLAPGSVRNVYEVMQRVLDAATEDRLIGSSPCRRITLPKDHDDEVEVPTLEAVEKVRAALDERWRVIPTVLAGSGLRVGELLGLGREDVDLKAGTIRVQRQRLQSGKLAPLKSKASRRTVPVGKVVTKALAAHLLRFPASDEALLVDERGRPLGYRRWKALLTAAAGAADVPLTSHSFRHFAASALISGGASVKQVQTFLGHSSAMVTLRTYAHLWPGDEDRTRNVLDAALSGLSDSNRTVAAPEQRPRRSERV